MKRRETLICDCWKCFVRQYEMPAYFLLTLTVFGAIILLAGWLK